MDANVLGTQIGAAAVFVWALQQLKRWPQFTLLRETGQKWIQRGLSIAVAGAVHMGISHVWNPGVAAGAGALTIIFPGWYVMAIGVWHWANQYIYQELGYQLVYNRVSVTSDATGSVPARIAPGGAVVVPVEAGK